jgi:hypothetical protein
MKTNLSFTSHFALALILFISLNVGKAMGQSISPCLIIVPSDTVFFNSDSTAIDTCGLTNNYSQGSREYAMEYITQQTPGTWGPNIYASHWWLIKFNQPAIKLPWATSDSIIEVSWQAIDSLDTNLRNGFQSLQQQFGSFVLRKEIPYDTAGQNSQAFLLRFSQYHNVDSVDNFIKSIDSTIVCSFQGTFHQLDYLPADYSLHPDISLHQIQCGQPSNPWPANVHKLGLQWNIYKSVLPVAWEITRGYPNTVISDYDDPATGSIVTQPDMARKTSFTKIYTNGIEDYNKEGNYLYLDGTSNGSLGNSWSGLTPNAVQSNPLRKSHALLVTSASVAEGDNINAPAGGMSCNDNGSGSFSGGMIGSCPQCEAVIQADNSVTGTSVSLLSLLHLDVSLNPSNSTIQQVSVVNIPSGCYGITGCQDGDAYNQIIQSGIVVVASAGNSSILDYLGNTHYTPFLQGPADFVYSDQSSYNPNTGETDPSKDYKVIAVGSTSDGDYYNPSNCSLIQVDNHNPPPQYVVAKGSEKFSNETNYSIGNANSASLEKFPPTTETDAQRLSDKASAFVDIVAPAGWVLGGEGDVTGYNLENGTSFSAPLVSGICGLMLSINPQMGVVLQRDPVTGYITNGIDVQRKVYNILTFTADKVGDGNNQFPYVQQTNDPLNRWWAPRMGFGRVNAFRSLAHAIPLEAPQSISSSTQSLTYSTSSINEKGEYLIHFGSYNNNGNPVLTNGGVNLPSTYFPGQGWNNQGETDISGSNVQISFQGIPGVMAVDGIVKSSGNGNYFSAPSGLQGQQVKVLATGYFENVGISGYNRLERLTVTGSAAGTADIDIISGTDGAVYDTVDLRNYATYSVESSGIDTIFPGGVLLINGNNSVALNGGNTVMKYSSAIITGSGAASTSDVEIANGATLEVASNSHVQILCNVHVQNGGYFVIDNDAVVEINSFKVDKGGTVTIGHGAHLNLMLTEANKINICNGKILMNGTSADPILLTGDPSNINCCDLTCDDNINGQAEIDAELQSGDNSPYHLYMSNVNVNSVDFKGQLMVNSINVLPNTTTTLLGGTTSSPTVLLKDVNSGTGTITANGTLYINLQNGGTTYTGSQTVMGTGGDVIDDDIHFYQNVYVEATASADFEGNITGEAGSTWNLLPGSYSYYDYVNQNNFYGDFLGGTAQSTTKTYINGNYCGFPSCAEYNYIPFFDIKQKNISSKCDMYYVEVNNASILCSGLDEVYCSNSDFKCGSATNILTLPDPFLDLEEDNKTCIVDKCTFFPNNGSGWYTNATAIEINGAMPANIASPITVSNSTFNYCGLGIYTNGMPCNIYKNIFNICNNAIIVNGNMGPSSSQLYSTNTMTGNAIGNTWNLTYTQNGILLYSAAPYLYENDISHFQKGVNAENAHNGGFNFPVLACNSIHDNYYGVDVYVSGDNIHMDNVSWEGNPPPPAQNTVENNTFSNIFASMSGGFNISLDYGYNNIVGNPGMNGVLINDLNALNNYTGFHARKNYWGITSPFSNTNDPPYYSSGGWARQNTWDWGSTPPGSILTSFNNSPCQATPQAPPPSNSSANCEYWSAMFHGQSGHYGGNICDSMVALYDMQMACGVCDSAIRTLENAIGQCDNQTRSTVQELLMKVLSSTLQCTGNDCSYLQPVDAWYCSFASSADSVYKQHAALWMHAQTLAAMQNFDSAASVYHYIAQQNWQAPEDSATANMFAANMQHISSVYGTTNNCWGILGKTIGNESEHYAGRAGNVPVTENPLFLETYPNPFNPIAQISFTVPDEDATDITEVRIFDMMARDVTTLIKDVEPAGRHTITFNASNLPSGRYIVAVHTLNHMQSKLVILTK